jgi:vesicle coat complex subunit
MRGVSVTNQIGLATIDVKKQEIAMRTKEINNNQRGDILMSMQMQMTNMCRLLESAVDIAKTMTSSFDENNFLWKKVIKQQEAIEGLQCRIDEFYDESKANADEETRKRKISEDEPKESNKKPPSVIELLNNGYKTDDDDEDFSDSNKDSSNKKIVMSDWLFTTRSIIYLF